MPGEQPLLGRVWARTMVVRELEQRGIEVEDVSPRRPTLDEVFLSLTAETAA